MATAIIQSASNHEPVMLEECITSLQIQPGGRYVDCTVGGGGHSAMILEHMSSDGRLIGVDADPDAIRRAREKLQKYGENVILVNDNFKNLATICAEHGFYPVNGILFDLGMSSLQLDGANRGFSFQHDAPLDMRFSPGQVLTAADIVNTYTEHELAQLLYTYGEERRSWQIARYIVEKRPLNTTLELALVVEQAVSGVRGKIHPATKTFQALRMAVNEELENLKIALDQALDLLGSGGRIVVISFHSLEDRLVKNRLRIEAMSCICPPELPVCMCGHIARYKIISKKAIRPSAAEVKVNPRSRSARMRVAECI